MWRPGKASKTALYSTVCSSTEGSSSRFRKANSVRNSPMPSALASAAVWAALSLPTLEYRGISVPSASLPVPSNSGRGLRLA